MSLVYQKSSISDEKEDEKYFATMYYRESMGKKAEKDGWWAFLTLCSHIHSPEEFKKLFDLFLTIEEKETIGRRFLIVKALREGKLTQREIANEFHVSISQITRGSNALKIIDPALAKILGEFL